MPSSPPQASAGGQSKSGYPSSPYLSRTSPMGQSSSPPSQSSGSQQWSRPQLQTAVTEKRLSGSGDGSRPSSQDRQSPAQPLSEQRPKTPVQCPKTAMGTNKPPPPQPAAASCRTQQPNPGGWHRQQTTSTPKLADPYHRHQTVFNQQQQQATMLQSKSLVPETPSGVTATNKQSLSLDPSQWNKSYSDISSRSVTPPLPPLSPDNTPPITPPPHSPEIAAVAAYRDRRPDVVTSSTTKKTSPSTRKKPRSKSSGVVGVKTWDGRSKRTAVVSAAGRAAYGRATQMGRINGRTMAAVTARTSGSSKQLERANLYFNSISFYDFSHFI